jgi:hypothetical protein
MNNLYFHLIVSFVCVDIDGNGGVLFVISTQIELLQGVLTQAYNEFV